MRIESGFELLLTLDHLALAPLAQSSEPLTVQLWYADDAGYEWRCEVIPRLHGTDTQGRLLSGGEFVRIEDTAAPGPSRRPVSARPAQRERFEVSRALWG